MLAPMQYRDFVWPNNPRVFEVEYRRTLHSYKLPFSGYDFAKQTIAHLFPSCHLNWLCALSYRTPTASSFFRSRVTLTVNVFSLINASDSHKWVISA